MKAVLKLVAALLAILLIAIFGTLSFVKSKQASTSAGQLKQAVGVITSQKKEIDTLKTEIDDLHEKLRVVQSKLAAISAPSGPSEVGVCPAAAAPVPVETPDGSKTPLGLRYQSGVLRAFNTGASLRITAAPGGRLQVGAEMYDLKHIHLVRPEGGLLNGRPAALAAHLVHSTASGDTVVVTVLLRESAFQNRTVWLLLNNVPAPGALESTIANISIDPTQLLPDNRGYEVFRGSLPFAPCSPNIRFFQFNNSIGVSKDQVERFVTRITAAAADKAPVAGAGGTGGAAKAR